MFCSVIRKLGSGRSRTPISGGLGRRIGSQQATLRWLGRFRHGAWGDYGLKPDDHFGLEVAARYDRDHGTHDPNAIATTVALLAELAEAGPVLEFAIGTGRIAIPLIEQSGIDVHGIELSEAMVTHLRAKDGGADIPVTIGDMAATAVDGEFSLVFLVFNTLSNLTSQDAQIACFRNAADHLRPGGRFLVENMVPPLQRLPLGETRLAFARSERHWGIDEIDVVSQDCVSHHLWMDEDGIRSFSLPFRYAWPSELDLMARMAGLELEHRWAGWDRAPFTELSTSHVSVWRKKPDRSASR